MLMRLRQKDLKKITAHAVHAVDYCPKQCNSVIGVR
jgi:hypothetical protein